MAAQRGGGEVRVVESTVVKVLPFTQPPPPPPVKLSMLDVFWMTHPVPVQKLLLYSRHTINISQSQLGPSELPFQSLLQLLKPSLFTTLQDVLPLAGKLVYNQEPEHVEIALSSPSFTFIDAESDLDLHQLATDPIHDVKSFHKLFPPIDVTVLTRSVFAEQVTRFACGRIAIGYPFYHAVVDGKGIMQFMEAWARTCKTAIIEGESGMLLRE